MPAPNDIELLAAARSDAASFAAFYDRHEAPLLAFLVRATRDPETAADLAADRSHAARDALDRLLEDQRAAVEARVIEE